MVELGKVYGFKIVVACFFFFGFVKMPKPGHPKIPKINSPSWFIHVFPTPTPAPGLAPSPFPGAAPSAVAPWAAAPAPPAPPAAPGATGHLGEGPWTTKSPSNDLKIHR